MDPDVRNSEKHKSSKIDAESVSQKENGGVEREGDEESDALLSPRRGGMSKRPRSVRRKVQWNDRNGNKLFEVLEFQPR